MEPGGVAYGLSGAGPQTDQSVLLSHLRTHSTATSRWVVVLQLYDLGEVIFREYREAGLDAYLDFVFPIIFVDLTPPSPHRFDCQFLPRSVLQ
jgi:hypothetical protein